MVEMLNENITCEKINCIKFQNCRLRKRVISCVNYELISESTQQISEIKTKISRKKYSSKKHKEIYQNENQIKFK
jgi:hypothetical protein